MATQEIDLLEETSHSHGWHARDEAEFFGEEIFPNLIDEEKKGGDGTFV